MGTVFVRPVFLKWATIGILTKLIDIFVFSIFLNLFSSLLLINALSSSISFIFNFLSHFHFTFRHEKAHITKVFIRYASSNLLFFVIDTFLILFIDEYMDNLRYSKILSTIFLTLFSYPILKHWVYKRTN